MNIKLFTFYLCLQKVGKSLMFNKTELTSFLTTFTLQLLPYSPSCVKQNSLRHIFKFFVFNISPPFPVWLLPPPPPHECCSPRPTTPSGKLSIFILHGSSAALALVIIWSSLKTVVRYIVLKGREWKSCCFTYRHVCLPGEMCVVVTKVWKLWQCMGSDGSGWSLSCHYFILGSKLLNLLGLLYEYKNTSLIRL